MRLDQGVAKALAARHRYVSARTALLPLAMLLVAACSQPSTPCTTDVPCTEDSQCAALAGTSCNTIANRCQRVLCGGDGAACSTSDHCVTGLACRGPGVCRALADDAGSPPADAGTDGSADDAPVVDPCPNDYSGTYTIVENPLNDRICSDPSWGFGSCMVTPAAGGYRFGCDGVTFVCATDADCRCVLLDGPDGRSFIVDFPSRSYEVSAPLGATCQGEF